MRSASSALLLFFVASAPPREAGAPKQDQTERQIVNSLERIAATLQNRAGAPVGDPPCSAGEDDRNSDLCAQWKAADATNSGAGAAWLFGTLGVLIGAGTLLAAIKAAQYAKKAADHTEAGAIAARDALSNDRAWLCARGVDTIHYSGNLEGQIVRNGLAFRVVWENAGRSPAFGIAVTAGLNLVFPGPREEVIIPIGDLEDIDGPGVMGPGKEGYSNVVHLNEEQSALFRRQGCTLAIRSLIIYRHKFSDDKCRTFTGFEITHQGGMTGEGTRNDGQGREAINFQMIPPYELT